MKTIWRIVCWFFHDTTEGETQEEWEARQW
jgi:hypothetical protein